MAASQNPVAEALVSAGLTTSIPNDNSSFWPGPVELFDTFNANVALVAENVVSVNLAVVERVAPSWVVE